MRITMLSVAPVNMHGWGRYTRDLIAALATLDNAPEIRLLTSIDAPPQREIDLPVAAYHRVLPSLTPAPRLSSLRLLAAIPTVARLTAGSDIVHVIVEPYALTVPLARRVFVTAHGTYTARTAAHRLFGSLYRRVYQAATIVCVSTYTEAQVRAALGDVQTVVIPNGVDVTRYQQPGTAPIKRGPTVLAVGQHKPRKGFHILAQAMRQVREVIPDAQAIFIGDTSDTAYCNAIQAQLEADHLSDTVHLLGRVPDDVLLGWYHAADVFALPALNVDGKFEGFGLVYLEASTARLPVIGTRDCGAEDAIRDGETGFLIPQNDVSATAQALIRLLSDSELRSKMGAAGANFAVQNSWERVAARVLVQYQERLRP
jgi:phosphatidyl-myo-inositol dimannoside synthase